MVWLFFYFLERKNAKNSLLDLPQFIVCWENFQLSGFHVWCRYLVTNFYPISLTFSWLIVADSSYIETFCKLYRVIKFKVIKRHPSCFLSYSTVKILLHSIPHMLFFIVYYLIGCVIWNLRITSKRRVSCPMKRYFWLFSSLWRT